MLVFFRGFIPLVLLFVIKLLIDEVTQALEVPLEDRSYRGALIVVGYAGILFLVNSVSASISVFAREKQAHKVNDYVQALIHNKTTKIHYSFFENPDYQDVYHRAINDANYRPTKIFYGLVGVFQNLITLLFLGIMLLSLNWLMSVVLLTAIIPTTIYRIFSAKKMFLLRRSQTEDERKLAYYNRLLTLRDYAKELRVFNLGNLFENRFDFYRNIIRNAQLKLLVRKTIGELISLVFTVGVIVAFYAYIVIYTLQGEISGGEMVMYFLALQRGYGYFQDLMSKLSSLYEDSLFVRNFIDFLNIKISLNNGIQVNTFPDRITSGVTFNNVHFRYDDSKKWVLKDVNLHINPGETIALVGNNGAGKSTFIKLLSGLYDVNSGGIFIDGIDIKTISRDSISDNISVIFQDFMLYNVSARENIWFGNVRESISKDKIYHSANDAGVHDLISNLPNGYDTILGNLFKDSEQLSQGEWQRIALARSFYNNAQLIILDEPTSSLDAFKEAELIHHFKEITKGKTSIIISHRLSTILLADRIAVLNDSCITEMGTYNELMENRGVFYNMAQAFKCSYQ
ncbi:MAG: ABC transporter ATP-binding protein [Marinilabiliaceae bacterium]|nr:ABC transporter ATP-binding protein [Marinilabiliaceae bacterium]